MIDRLRKEIDRVDSQILKLIAKRMKAAKKIGIFKKKNNMKIVDLKREKELLSKISSKAKRLRLNNIFTTNLFKTIIKESRKQQK